MTATRDRFQKIYDLTERVLPSWVETSVPGENEIGEFFVRRALTALGIATTKEIREHIHGANQNVIHKAITRLVDAEKILRITVKNIEETQYYALPETLENLRRKRLSGTEVFLLSPFDNLVIQRERIERLFGFEYRIECYTPPAKRKYGYFTLPILLKDRFIGRLDPKADRKKRRLIIRNMVFEPGFTAVREIIPFLLKKLDLMARFNGCDTVSIEHVSPTSFKKYFH